MPPPITLTSPLPATDLLFQSMIDNSPAHRREAVPADPLGQHRRYA